MQQTPQQHKITVHVYAQHCVRAGQRAYEPTNSTAPAWPGQNNDICTFIGTREQIRRYADQLNQSAGDMAGGTYSRRVARTLREAAA